MNIYERIKHDIQQDYYTQNYANEGQRFIAWYLRNIYGLDTTEAKNCVTDGANDKQIDAVYISDKDETVYIIQGKFLQKGKTDAKPLLEIYSAWLQVKDLQHLQENSNNKLSGKINEISSAINDDNYDVCFELVTTSELTKSAQKEAEHYRQELSNNEDINANLVVLDESVLEKRYNESINLAGAGIDYEFHLETGRYMDININGTRAVIAVIPLKECVNIPGINDGSLFRKNVRQALNKTTKVNKDIVQSLKKSPGEFFFMHNGITAICSSLRIDSNILSVEGLSVVNGCQSLTAIYGSSESVKAGDEGYIIFRFYEIADVSRGDIISTSTNSQNAVKPRDLRSNDKYILELKKAYEQCYPDGQFITKRGEKTENGKNPQYVIELSLLAKLLMSWHIQKPSDIHVESKIFMSDFDILFHRVYTPEKVQALNEIYKTIYAKWDTKNGNPLNFNETLFKHKSYAPYWHVFALSVLICEINKISGDFVPYPDAALRVINDNGILESVIELAGNSVDEAFMSDSDDAHDNGKIFNPPNWFKSSKTINSIRSAVRKSLKPYSTEDKKRIAEIKEKLKMSKKDFEPRWGSE